MARVRIRFTKLGKIRWTSHRDVARMWERAFRRVQLPLAYSEGFSPRPRVSFGLALPTGHESLAEYLDADEMHRRAAQLLASPSVTVTRLRKGAEMTDDIRDAVLDLRVVGPDPAVAGGVRLQAELACQPRSLRPSELLAGLGADLTERDTRRLHQWISRDGARREPLEGPAAATDAPHALERVS